ncbi:LysM peptidoglycan-binding domain-containing protein [Streptococcus suis]|uniref:LysM peptidoglycan-binding domain-containing protein n=1 Tax=Streptococcus suis TaxID=1307 RepID=A0A4T2GQ89_STRSU|nr:LysM peptidoglycan-binding domain-containing protein [Streptococcus suis]MBM7269234.1 LysM peptidoglycan-binding domain-containing protein [Streptococcus suis]TII01263.1 LysM peptidoglycan-binding domain-containing protein [Streptococcus suis]
MSQEPWNEEIYEATETSRKSRVMKGYSSSKIFTILAVIFAIIVLAIIITALYLSMGGSNTNSTEGFYNASASSAVVSSTTESSSSSTSIESSTSTEESTEVSSMETTASSSSSTLTDTGDGSTLTVQAGEGVGSIAARAGISIAQLESLNPEKMTTGSWLAHPGDVVRIK